MQLHREPDAADPQGGAQLLAPSKRCVEAVLVEPRKLVGIRLALETAALVRDGPGGGPAIDKLTLVHGKNNSEFVDRLLAESPTLAEARASGRLRLLPVDVGDLGADSVQVPFAIGRTLNSSSQGSPEDNRGASADADDLEWHSQYSRLLFNASFWEHLQCDDVLTMQSDTLLCLNSEVRLSEFTGYDFVGAVACGDPAVSNGGLSLRNRQAMIKCARRGPPDINMNEDIFFSQLCPDVTRKADDALRDRFAIDNGFRHTKVPPFGLHKPWGIPGFRGPFEDQNLDSCQDARTLQGQQHT